MLLRPASRIKGIKLRKGKKELTEEKHLGARNSLRASSPIWASEASLARTRERGAEGPAPRGFAARSRVLARLVSLAQIGELARRLSKEENQQLTHYTSGVDARI